MTSKTAVLGLLLAAWGCSAAAGPYAPPRPPVPPGAPAPPAPPQAPRAPAPGHDRCWDAALPLGPWLDRVGDADLSGLEGDDLADHEDWRDARDAALWGPARRVCPPPAAPARPACPPGRRSTACRSPVR